MLTEYEAWKLRGDMKRELNAGPGVVLKYAGSLFLLIGLAWIGVDSKDTAGRDSPPPAPLTSAKAERYSRAVFEERRQRHIEANPDSHVAREAAQKIRS